MRRPQILSVILPIFIKIAQKLYHSQLNLNDTYIATISGPIIGGQDSFHKSAKTKELIENAGCTLKYLPPYSPDFNPIENQWAILKNRIKKHKNPDQTILQAVDYVFRKYQ